MSKLKFILRDINRTRSQAIVFSLCVSLAMVTLVAVNGFSDSVNTTLLNDARALNAADIIVRSRQPLSPGLVQKIAKWKARCRLKAPQSMSSTPSPELRQATVRCYRKSRQVERLSILRPLRIGFRALLDRSTAPRPHRRCAYFAGAAGIAGRGSTVHRPGHLDHCRHRAQGTRSTIGCVCIRTTDLRIDRRPRAHRSHREREPSQLHGVD